MRTVGVVCGLAAMAAAAAATGSAERITNLPGFNASALPSFSQYSGYVNVDEAHGRAMFYWYTEAMHNRRTAPVVVWLNGGPGCSSLGGGLMSELGPYFPQEDGTLAPNEYAWNTIAHMVFPESPAGVGFSYSNTSSDYNVGDARTSQDLYTFLQGFYDLHPELRSNKLFIAGESYGGHYVPNFAHKIVEENMAVGPSSPKYVNFEGFLVGNAWTDAALDNTGAAFDWWTHGLVTDDAFHGIVKQCNVSNIGPLMQKSKRLSMAYSSLLAAEAQGERFDSGDCQYYQNLAMSQMGSINIYDIYVDVCPNTANTRANHFLEQLGRVPPATSKRSMPAPGSGLLRGHQNQRRRNLAGDDTSAGGSAIYDPCIAKKVAQYLNRADVQDAIHVRRNLVPTGTWSDCSDIVNYSRQDLLTSMLPVYRDLFKAGVRIMVYSGDVDAIVPITGTRSWIEVLDLPIKEDWRAYEVNGQVGGYTVLYEPMRFTSVRNAGHMVPYTQRARAFHIFERFINDQPM